jgi:hypothetical protein
VQFSALKMIAALIGIAVRHQILPLENLLAPATHCALFLDDNTIVERQR